MLPKAQDSNLSIQDSSERVAFFGGLYSNYLALGALLEHARARGIQRLYCLGDLGAFGHDGNPCRLQVDFVRLLYDHERLAAEMTSEGLPDEFIETIQTGWWTTCNEILPAKERARGIY